MPFRFAIPIRGLLLVAIAFATATAEAHEGATGLIADRMSVMKEMAQSMKTVGDMLSGRQQFEMNAAIASIAALHKNCIKAREQFTSGTRDHASRASPAIWEKPDDFKAEMDRFDAAVEALAAGAETGTLEGMGIPFKNVGQSCSSCHERFRLPK